MALLKKEYLDNQLRRAHYGTYKVHGSVDRAACLVGIGFGFRQNENGIAPSSSTEQLATYIAQHYDHLPKILTHDLTQAYKKLRLNSTAPLYTTSSHRQLTLVQLLTECRDIMKDELWKHTLLVGHPHHMPWLDYICGQIDIMTVAPAGLETVGFDPESVQPWTQNKANWQETLGWRHGNARHKSPSEVFNQLLAERAYQE